MIYLAFVCLFAGDENSSRQDVDNFYNFWYDFESWREYSYLDEEDKDKGQDREERRWIEKQNKAIRIKRKKEEMARIRQLVDLAYNNDPRIVKFRNEDKEKKQAAKRARMSAAQAQRAEEERILKEAQLAKEKAEQAEQKRIEQIRIEKEQQKRALKKEKKLFRDFVKEQNYYSTDEKEKLRNMEGVEKICEMLKMLELQTLNKDLGDGGGRDLFMKVLKETEDKLEEERRALFPTKSSSSAAANASAIAGQTPKQSSLAVVDKNAIWSAENMQMLIKAVNLFPAGTVQRWEVIANYLNQHGTIVGNQKFIARDVLNKAKDLQSSDFAKNSLKAQANDNAFASFEKTKKELKIIDRADISLSEKELKKNKAKQNGIDDSSHNTTAVNDTNKMNGQVNGGEKTPASVTSSESTTSLNKSEPRPWTKEEQALLEQAIKTYPITTADRWDRIAECIPNRTKKECLRRVKELVDRVNAKRDATQIVK